MSASTAGDKGQGQDLLLKQLFSAPPSKYPHTHTHTHIISDDGRDDALEASDLPAEKLLREAVRSRKGVVHVLGGGGAAAVTPTDTHRQRHHPSFAQPLGGGKGFVDISTKLFGSERDVEAGSRVGKALSRDGSVDYRTGSDDGKGTDLYKEKIMGMGPPPTSSSAAASGHSSPGPASMHEQQYRAPIKPPSGKKKSTRVLNSLATRYVHV